MPQMTRSTQWFWRVTIPHATFRTVWNTIWNNGVERNELIGWGVVRMLAVGHVGDKTEKEHVHVIMETEMSRQQQSINARIKTAFGVKGAQYSTKIWDGRMGIGAGSYLFHDPQHVILFNHNFTDEEIETFKTSAAQVAEIVEEKKSKASGRCVERVLADIKIGGRPWTRKEILTRLCDDIKNGVMYEPGDFVLKKYAEEIYMKQIEDPKKWEEYRNYRVANLLWCRETQEQVVEIFLEQ